MKKLILISIIFLLLPGAIFAQEDFTKYVDPTIGNVSRFLVPTYPTIQLPNQMMRMFPIKQDYISDQVEAFPLQVTSHRSKGYLGMKVSLGDIVKSSWDKKMNIDHDLEIVHPWLYSTYLIDDDIRVSFTPGEKGAIYKIEFPAIDKKNILIKGTGDMISSSKDGSSFTFEEKIKYTTRGVKPVTSIMSLYVYGIITDENGKPIKNLKPKSDKENFSITLSKDAPSTVYIKYAISYISHKQAKINFKKEKLTRTNFTKLAEIGKKKWEKVINQIQVEGGTDAQRRSFYTALYRTYERMLDINEYGKYYSGYDSKVHKSDRPFYVDDWIWDTFRAHHPLRTILDPEIEDDMLNSYTLMYEQSGWMPTFPQVYRNHMCMNSYHSSAIFIDGYRKGLKNYDVEKAYQGIKKNLTEATFIPWRQGTPRLPIDDFYHENGYFPSLRPGEKETEPMMDKFEKRQNWQKSWAKKMTMKSFLPKLKIIKTCGTQNIDFSCQKIPKENG